MSRKIALFANGDVGLLIAKYLENQGDEVAVLFLAGQYPTLDSEILDTFSGNPNMHVGNGDLRQDVKGNLELLNISGINTIITVYWPFILPNEVLDLAELSVNFHPALLPANRGWYPHVHNLIDGSPAGVTLHKLAPGADEGDIWAQKVVEVEPWDCAGDLYKKLQTEITKLFIETWPQIKSASIKAQPQSNENQSYHSKKEIESLDRIELDKNYTGAEIVNLLRARTFGEKGFAYFDSGEDKVFISIKLEKRT